VATRKKKEKGLLVLLGNGDMSFAAHEPVAPGSVDLDLGDLDGDGDPDVVVTEASPASGTKVLLNDGSGIGFSAPTPALDFSASAIALADLDADGALDLLASNPPAPTLFALYGDGQGAFSMPEGLTLDGVPESFQVLDIDRNGILDIASTLDAQPVLEIFDGLGAGTFSAPRPVSLPIEPNTFVFTDLDSDRVLDLAIACEDGGGHSLHLLFAQTPGFFGASVEGPSLANIQQLLAADFDRDGLMDLLGLTSNAQLGFFRNTGGGDLALPTRTAVDFMQRMIVDDFNGDDRPDLSLQSNPSNLVRVIPNVLPGFPSLGFQHPAGSDSPHLVATGVPAPNEVVSFTVAGVQTPAFGALFLGLQFAPQSFAGGVLVPSPDAILPMRPQITLAGRWPSLSPGTKVFAQAWFLSSAGTSASNSIMAVTP
jgi:hypothetical protein